MTFIIIIIIIIIIRRVQPTSCKVSQFNYFCKTIYMFQLLMMEGKKVSETCRASYRNK